MPRFRLFLLLLPLTLLHSASVITTKLDDPRAVYVSAPAGEDADSAAALQAAIDESEHSREGIVFVPSGRYRLSRTLYVWPGVRVFGYGSTRPVFVLPAAAPGFDEGIKAMVIFTGVRRTANSPRVPFPPPNSVPPNPNIADANPNTFYSAMSNIDFEIGDNNPAAVAIRFHVAQHAFLTHMDFHIGSGIAALYQVGNEGEDLHFSGGRYGILTEKTSPAWQFTLIDSRFDGQREAAIREHEAGLTLIRDTFRNVPVAIDIDPHYSDQLWVKESRFENIGRAVVIVSNQDSPLTEIGFESCIADRAPVFALFRESGRKITSKDPVYIVHRFNRGIILPGEDSTQGTVDTIFRSNALGARNELPPLVRAIRPLPPSTEWVNVHTLGITGDGKTDDTAAIQHAIDTHRALYFPSGHYVVRDTLKLAPNSVLIGLHPTLTQFDLLDDTPGFEGIGAPRALLEAPQRGSNILTGIGIFTGGSNPRAAGVIWQAGENSLVDDVRFLGGHGSGTNPYNNNHTADADLHKRWDSQYPSLWITNGGGGTFADIWTPNTFAQAGFFVSNTRTPGHVYELSNEHHARNEIKFDHAENWDLNAPQTEEEAGESPEALSLELDYSRNITIANYHAYRVTRTRAPFPTAVRLYHSEAIRFRNVHVNAESGYGICDEKGCGTFLRVSKYPYENAIQDVTRNREIREREFAALDIPAQAPAGTASRGTSEVRKLADGFFSISGATVDKDGKLYFVDHHEQRIYGWSQAGGLSVERDNPLDPVNLAGFDASGNLIVISSFGPEGTVYSFHPGSPATELTLLKKQATKTAQAAIALPINYWNNGEFQDQLNLKTFEFTTLAQMFLRDVSTVKPSEYVSLDGTLRMSAGRVFQQGPAADTSGWRFSDNLDTYGFITAMPGQRVYISSESEDITYSALLNQDGTLSDLRAFVNRGGECVAVDHQGNVYVANGEIFVYGKDGKQMKLIEVPERPIDIVFGGPDRRTLFILAHHALYSIEVE